MVKLHDLYFKPFISAQEIDAAVQNMVDAIALELGDEMPVFIGILNGSFMLVSDFVKKYPKPCEVTFIKLASYEGVKSTEDIQRLIGLTQDLTGRTVVVLEDIIDSGNTLEEVHRIFKNENVKQLLIATLFYKPESYDKDFKLHYVGMEIPNKFIVGYGLDYNGLGRGLPDVYQLKTTQYMTNLVLFGAPGAGKGTQAQLIVKKHNYFQLSTGDLLRNEVKKNTKLGNEIEKIISKGNFVSDETVNKLLKFNGICSYILRDVLGIIPKFMSVDEVRRIFCPEMTEYDAKKNKFTLKFKSRKVDPKTYIFEKIDNNNIIQKGIGGQVIDNVLTRE